jgi:hypothetical protein
LSDRSSNEGGRQPYLDFSSLQEVTINIESTVKDFQDIDISRSLDKVGYPVVSVEKYADFATGNSLVFVPDFRLLSEQLGFFVNGRDNIGSISPPGLSAAM